MWPFVRVDREKFLHALVPFGAGALAYRALRELNTDVLDFEVYRHMFGWLPSGLIFTRYCISILGRELLLLALVLILMRKEVGRKAVIFLSYVMILTVYLKHPYEAVVSINRYYATNLGEFQRAIYLPWAPEYPLYPLMVWRTVNLCLEDILIGAITVVFFSSAVVKKRFR